MPYSNCTFECVNMNEKAYMNEMYLINGFD